jgi:CheY-like chemotaxis protein
MSTNAPLSILVIEDHPELQEAIRTLLERAGYRVLCAVNVDDAMQLLRSAPRPCLLLWDPLTLRLSLTLLAESARQGVNVATLPIGVSALHDPGASENRMKKRITSTDAILSIVRAHCAAQHDVTA